MNSYLPSRRVTAEIQPNWGAPAQSAPSLALPDTPTIWSVIRRNRITILIAFSVCVLASLAIMELQTPLFRAQALVEVQDINENFLRRSDYESTSEGTANGAFIATQIRRLQSEALATKVVQETDLNDDPSFFRESPGLEAIKRDLHLLHRTGEHSVGETASRLLRALRTRIEGESNLISIETQAPDSQLAAKLSNTLASRYIADEQDDRAKAALQTSMWLTNQLEDVRVRLQTSERELQDYAKKAGLLFLGENSTVTDEELKQVQEELSKVQALRAQQEAELRLVASAPADTLPQVVDDPPMREYQSRLTDLRRQVADLRTTLTPEHYKVQRLQAEAVVVEQAIEGRRATILNRIRNEYATSIQREALLNKAYGEQANAVTNDLSKSIRYNVLKREVDANRQLYSSMMQRVKEASLLSAVRTSSLRLVEPARPPSRPASPSLLKTGGFGILSGIFSAIFLVLLRERLDNTFRRRGEIHNILGVPEIGVIPALPSRELLKLSKRASLVQPSTGAGLNRSTKIAEIPAQADDSKTSLFMEAFHCAATSIALQSKRGEVSLITSPHPRAGKSMVVAYLGMALARAQRRGIILDGDLRRPSLHSIFGIDLSPGLADILKNDRPISEQLHSVIRESPVPGLSLMTVGNCGASDWRLLEWPRMADILSELRKEYDFILIDSPPMLHLTDGRILAKLADSVLLVCRAGQTRADQAAEAARLLWCDGSQLAGTILNGWDVNAEDPSYYRAYYSHYGSVS